MLQNIMWWPKAAARSNRKAAKKARVMPQPGQGIPRKVLKMQGTPNHHKVSTNAR